MMRVCVLRPVERTPIVAFPVIAESHKQLEDLPAEEWKSKLYYIDMIEHYRTVKRNELHYSYMQPDKTTKPQ